MSFLRRQFAGNIKGYCLGKIRKNISNCRQLKFSPSLLSIDHMYVLYICIYACMCIFMYVYVCVYVCVYMYVYIFFFFFFFFFNTCKYSILQVLYTSCKGFKGQH